MKKPYKILTGKDIFTITEEMKQPLIEGFMSKGDYIMLVAEEKKGKTILSQQLSACCTSGRTFLNTFDVNRPCKVWYFATEGRTEDLQDRFIKINNHVKINLENLTLIPTAFQFNTPTGIQALSDICDEIGHKPDVIIIDALYRAIKGSLKDDEAVNDFHSIIGRLQHQLDHPAVVLVHHMTKPAKDKDGNNFRRTDKDLFGSAFLSAAVDHIFYLDSYKKGGKMDRILKCDTQRSGQVVDTIHIRLNAPDPLFFSTVKDASGDITRIMKVLQCSKEPIDITEIESRTKISRSKLFPLMKEITNGGFDGFNVVKEGSYRKTYRITS